jgi:5-formyltetrahydrofolate cyclo-ligase
MDKEEVRRLAWAALREAGAARFPGVEGRIPNFVGAEAAARLLADTPEWAAATAIKANPDSPQLPVRQRALEDGKVVYMAVPKLASQLPFWRLDPERLEAPLRRAASIKGAAKLGMPVTIGEMDRIDLIVCGSVAVEVTGARLGKGGGYSDLEYAVTTEEGLVGDWTTIATTVHSSQLVEPGTIPVTDHDFPLDVIVEPDSVIRTRTGLPRPAGVVAGHLSEEKRSGIPVLADRPDR